MVEQIIIKLKNNNELNIPLEYINIQVPNLIKQIDKNKDCIKLIRNGTHYTTDGLYPLDIRIADGYVGDEIIRSIDIVLYLLHDATSKKFYNSHVFIEDTQGNRTPILEYLSMTYITLKYEPIQKFGTNLVSGVTIKKIKNNIDFYIRKYLHEDGTISTVGLYIYNE